ncbi:MAG: tetratricopeptide repeat protein [Lachnospiraceae bacterium]|nr:tetratricopeptide repeat protein [Butyrivibrio sp.]MCM1342214.1 tetratricopeptide repeat protein [Muribaculaceae bacterium]MCM1409211.1 tetratricopeptide repeat protein [Lachnospiraceae bacterium]
MKKETTDMGKGKKPGKQKTRGMFLTYIILALFLIVMQALVFICGRTLFMLIFHGGDVSVPFFTKVRAAMISVVVLAIVFRFGIRVIPALPDIIRRMKYDDQQKQAHYNALLDPYFSEDKKVRDQMMYVLGSIDHKRYLEADEICVKLLEKCTVPEERAVILFCRMICQGEMGSAREAVRLGERALSLRGDFMPAMLETAGYCIKCNKLADAENYLLKIQETGWMRSRVYRMLYEVYAAGHRYDEALMAALRWERLEPDSLEAAACVCRAAHRCGERDLVTSRLQRCRDEQYEGYAVLKMEVRGYSAD